MPSELSCDGLSKRFGETLAVDGVSFTVPGGSFFSILGPSGCGKTTLMRMIAGFEEPSAGDIRLGGRSVLDMPPNRRNVKMVFQNLALFPMMNVGENIAYGLRCQGLGRSQIEPRVKAVLERVGLPGVEKRQINQLSGGQRQRIAIARCMVLEPDILLLDEPLGALDLKLRERMKIELKLLQHQFKTTFLYITHDQSEALVMSDRVAVMNRGRFEQIGSPHELYNAPASAFVAGFVGDSNRWEGSVAGHDGTTTVVETGTGFRIGASAPTQLAKGTPVAVFVRPEAIAVSRTAPRSGGAPANALPGVIEGLLFNGANSRFLIRSASGEMIEADLPQTGIAADLKPGEGVDVTWTAGHTRCFPV